jgi:putative component of membrane protein insertase Oxa1/YidC/SpoIIIJ protein YidD
MANSDCSTHGGEFRRLWVGAIAARALIWAINQYQRYISPRKGFVCAHRVLHSGDSCSDAVKRAAAEHGVSGAWGMSRRRFRECRAAAHALASRRLEERFAEEAERKRKRLQETEGKLPHWLESCDCTTSACNMLSGWW